MDWRVCLLLFLTVNICYGQNTCRTNPSDSKCYCVFGANSTDNWHEAASFCNEAYGILVDINSQDTNDFVTSLMTAASVTEAWVGVKGANGSSATLVSDPSTTMSYTPTWTTSLDSTKMCASITSSGDWEGMNCSNSGIQKIPICRVPPIDASGYNIDTGCPFNGFLIGNKCYQIFTWTTGKNFDNAVDFCKAEGVGGKLILPTSDLEYQLILKVGTLSGLDKFWILIDYLVTTPHYVEFENELNYISYVVTPLTLLGVPQASQFQKFGINVVDGTWWMDWAYNNPITYFGVMCEFAKGTPGSAVPFTCPVLSTAAVSPTAPTTVVSTTEPTTSTQEATTDDVSTVAISTTAPTTVVSTTEPTTVEPPISTQRATTADISTAAISTIAPTTIVSTIDPTTVEPTTSTQTSNSEISTNVPRIVASTTVSTTTVVTADVSTTIPNSVSPQDELQGILDSLNQSASDENLDAAANWIVANPTVPDNVNDLENYAQRFLKVCSIMIHNNHTSYWKNSDAPVEVSSLAGSCSSVIDDLAKSSDSDQLIITDNVVATTKVFAKTSEFSNIEVDLFNGTEVSISKDDFEQLGIDENKKISVSIVSYKYGELLTGSNDDEGPVSGVVSITLFADGEKTSLPVSFTLTTDKARVENSASEEQPTCVYQDIDSNGEITWKSDGCSVSGIEDSQVTCHCQHTTNFAVLMQVKEVKLAERDVVALDWITRICCSLSIIALIVTLAVLLFLRSLLRSERVTIHTNLVIALIMAQMLLLVSGLASANERACRAVAILMHYFFTAVFCWMLVEGGHLYLQIVRVFSAGKDRLRTYLAIGWGTPLLIVLITAASRWYGYGANGNCWLSTAYGMVWAFVAPALLIIAVNFVILIMVLRILVISAKSKSDGEYDHIKAGVKGALLLLPLLGTTWLFGVISFSADTVVFLYLFAIFNSLQGVFIFFLYCIFNSEVRNAFTRQKEKRALTRGEMDSTSTNMSGSDSRTKSSNRIYPDMTTKNTQVLDIKSTTTTTTHTKMVIEAHGPDMPEFDDDPPRMATEVD